MPVEVKCNIVNSTLEGRCANVIGKIYYDFRSRNRNGNGNRYRKNSRNSKHMREDILRVGGEGVKMN